MRRLNWRRAETARPWRRAAWWIGVAATLGGCARSDLTAGSRAEPQPVISGRPRVAQSATEVAPGGGSDQLDFFDELEKHPLATQDDAVHAVLLAFHGSSAPSYVQRAAIAKQLGLMDPGINQQPREAVTAGEVAQLLSGALRGAPSDTDSRTRGGFPTSQQALAALQAQGVLPADWRPIRGVTGPELLAAIKHTRRVIDERKHTAAGKE